MIIDLREDVISCLKTFIGEDLPEQCFRSGRIEYCHPLNNDIFFNVLFTKEDIQFEIELNFNKERYENIKKYSDIKDYEEWKNNEIENYKKRINEDISRDVLISQYYWTPQKKVIATGLKFFSKDSLDSLLANILFFTDEFGEPNFEDTKTIEWNVDNDFRLIIILPKRQYFSVLYGEKIFFDKTEVWKTNL